MLSLELKLLTLMQNPEFMILKQNKAKTLLHSLKTIKESDACDDASIQNENVSRLSGLPHLTIPSVCM